MAKTNTQNLTLLDRIVIPGILRAEGNYEQRIVVRELKTKISITQDDIKKFEIKTVGEGKDARLTWNKKGIDAKFPFEFTELEKLEIKLPLIEANNKEKLTDELIPLYEKFCL